MPDPECPERTDAWPTEPLGLHWLASQRGPVDALDRAFVEQACASPLSVFAVEQVAPGVSLDVRDVLTGRRFHTPELTASRSLRVGDLIVSRVVTLEGLNLLFGMAPYVAPPEWHVEVLDWRDHYFRKRAVTREMVADAEFDEPHREAIAPLCQAGVIRGSDRAWRVHARYRPACRDRELREARLAAARASLSGPHDPAVSAGSRGTSGRGVTARATSGSQ